MSEATSTAKRSSLDDAFGAFFMLAIVALICLLPLLIVHDERACAAAGGHLVAAGRGSICVDAEGRVLDSRYNDSGWQEYVPR